MASAAAADLTLSSLAFPTTIRTWVIAQSEVTDGRERLRTRRGARIGSAAPGETVTLSPLTVASGRAALTAPTRAVFAASSGHVGRQADGTAGPGSPRTGRWRA